MKNIFKKLKNHFIPHEGNDHQPHILRHRSISFILFFVMVLELSLLVQVFFVFNKTNYLASVLPGVLTFLTNEERNHNEALPLVENELLTKAAQIKANDMASRGYFSHNTPEGKTPWYFLDQVNYNYKLAGENLAVNFTESEDVTRAWMNSPGHRANIVKKDYTEIGIATAEGIYEGQKAIFVVQFFGKPKENIIKEVATKEITKTNTSISVAENSTEKVLGEETIIKTTPKKTASKPVATKTTQNLNTNIPTENIILEEKAVENNITTVALNQIQNIKKNPISFNKNYLNTLLTSPNNTVSDILYVTLGLFLILFLIYLISTEIMHPMIILRSSALIVVLFILLVANISVLKTNPKIPLNATSFSAIAL